MTDGDGDRDKDRQIDRNTHTYIHWKKTKAREKMRDKRHRPCAQTENPKHR